MPISEDLYRAMLRESTRFWALETQQTLALAALDQHYHSRNFMQLFECNAFSELVLLLHSIHSRNPDLQSGLQSVFENFLHVAPDTIPRYRSFRHLTSYVSSYYAYPWCTALADFIWTECFQCRPLDRHTGERYREHILAPGSSGNEWRRIEHMIGFKPSVDDLAEAIVTQLSLSK